MDDKRAALVLAGLALAGAAVKFLLAPPPRRAPGDATLPADTTTQPTGLGATARAAVRLSRPLVPRERVAVDQADVTEITRLPRAGPALARRIVDWRKIGRAHV